MLSVRKSCHFHASHLLTGYDGDCRNLHGHTYRVVAEVAQVTGDNADMVIDFHDLKGLLARVIAEPFDHAFIYDATCAAECALAATLQQHNLKTTPMPGRTTAENMARHFCALLRPHVNVTAVTVYETDDSCAEYRP